MKKTVSWSAETIKRKKAVSADATNTNRNDKPSGGGKPTTMTKSTSAFVPSQAPQVNLRIQNMIAMQKAQNATMRQLMSTGSSITASPSGLRDLVQTPAAVAPISISNKGKGGVLGLGGPPGGNNNNEPKPTRGGGAELYGNNVILSGASRTEPMKPPAPNNNNAFMPMTQNTGVGIHFQGPPKASNLFHPPANLAGMRQQMPSSTYNRDFRTSPDLSPAHLHPKLPANCGGGSPVSYNSVLGVGHNFPRFAEGIGQPSVVEIPKNIASEHEALPSMIGDISLNPRGHQHQPGYDNNANVAVVASTAPPPPPIMEQNQMINNMTHMKNTANPHQVQPVQPMQTLLHGAQDINDLAISPLIGHTHHKFQYGSNNFGDNRYSNPSAGVEDRGINNSMLSQQANHYFDTPNNATYRQMQTRIRRRRRNLTLAILCYPFQSLFADEHLCRSFCFGAIDGMLTGASILSALGGLGLLSQLEISDGVFINMKWIPIALTMAVAFADGLCMAVGHVWSTGFEAGAAYEERKEELRNFDICKSDAKARLVDALLMQGMLKIDAMSLADTLEGYPDIFVNALLGKGFQVEGNGLGMMRMPSDNAMHSQFTQQQVGDTWGSPSLSHQPGETGQSSLENESLYDLCDSRNDPDRKAMLETVAESRSEGFLMMLSFSSFSVIPSLVYTLLPPVVNFVAENGDNNDTYVKVWSLCLTSIIMFFLGVWKSHFYASNWFSFGLKNMGVMAICVATAYYFGFVCSLVIH